MNSTTTAEKLLPTLQELESRRRNRKRRDRIVLTTLLISGSALTCLSVLLAIENTTPASILGIIVGFSFIASGITHCFLRDTHSQYCRAYRALVTPKLLEENAPALAYSPKDGISEEEFTRIRLFAKSPDAYLTSDLIAGSHHKIDLRIAFVHSHVLESMGTGSHIAETQFRGALVVLDFHKSFRGKTYVFPDHSESRMGKVARAMQNLQAPPRTSLIQLEDTAFEKDFVVYSTDQVESRYLLSATMMEGLREVRKRFGRGVRFCFRKSELYIAIPSKGHFMNPKRRLPATEPHQIQILEKRLSILLGIIDDLDQRTRIWSKR